MLIFSESRSSDTATPLVIRLWPALRILSR